MKIQNAAVILLTSLQFTSCTSKAFASKSLSFLHHVNTLNIRGGETVTETADEADVDADVDAVVEEEESLEDRVQAAMKKLGLASSEEIAKAAEGVEDGGDSNGDVDANCENGVCEIKPSLPSPDNTESFQDMMIRLSKEMDVDENIVMAALGATMMVGTEPEEQRLDEAAARTMIQYEIDAIQKVMEDSDEVKQLISEGHEAYLSRRALAFADMNIEVARAILIADEEDAKEEEEQQAKMIAEQEEEEKRAQLRAEAEERKKAEAQMKTVNVDSNFDPTKPNVAQTSPPTAASAPQGAPKAAKKEDVVFQATSENIQKLVLESPVPVLLDVYADWCGPCKQLTPALEQMALKGGGMFRLVKLNTDEERSISGGLEVTSLPTVFGIKDGKIVNCFKGMPRDENYMRNFMMGLLGAGAFDPAPTTKEKEKYEELSKKLINIAGASGFSFSQRERMQVLTNRRLDEIVDLRGDMSDAEESAKVVRSLLSNVIRDPFETKFRKVNLENKIISARVGEFAPAVSILKSVGFKVDEDSDTESLILGKGKKFVSVAPIVVARDTIDKWIDMNRRAIATALRKKQDELARVKLLEEAEEIEESDSEEEEVPEIDLNLCKLKLRVEGKNKVHDIELDADEPLHKIVDEVKSLVKIPKEEELTITCTARRLIVKSSDAEAMAKTLRESKLTPAASIVIKIGSGVQRKSTNLKERAAARKEKSKGEHTMQSIGIYAKDDNAKGELIDGGGGVWYEQDVTTDDEGENEDLSEESEEEESSSEE